MAEASGLLAGRAGRLPAGLTLLYTLAGHTGRVNSVCWSPDGKWLASSSSDGTMGGWNLSTGRLLGRLEGSIDHWGISPAVVWSPDGKWLASGSNDGMVRVWNASTGRQLRVLEGHAQWISSVVWSPDGKWLASVSSDGVRVWDAGTGRLLRVLKDSHVGGWGTTTFVVWSPDGKWLASNSSDGMVLVWDASTGRQLRLLKSHTQEISSVVWSPDGKWLVAGSSDGTVRVWNPTTGDLLHILEGHRSYVNSVCWSPDGKWLASSSSDGTVRVWNANGLLHILEGHTGAVNSVVWSPDGKWLASSSSSGTPWSSLSSDVRIWHTETWEPLMVLTDLKVFTPVTWPLPLLVTAGQRENDLCVWHLDFAALLQAAPAPEIVHYTNAKMVLVGESGAGKSGLALVLTGQSFAPTDSTHGRRVWLLDQQKVQQDRKPREMREVLLWDLAGQHDYRLIHQLHLHEATIALIVFDAARDADPFAGIRHWHRALLQAQQASGATALSLKIFLIAARIDRGGAGISQARIDALLEELGCAGYIKTSAKDGRGIVELGQRIRAAIDWSKLPKVTSTTLLQAMKTFVRDEQRSGRLLRTVDDMYNAFLSKKDILPQQDKLRQQFETALGRLETQGATRQFGFGQLILLQPELLDAYASALLIAVKEEPDGLGSIPEVRVQRGDFSVPEKDRLPNSTQEQLLLIAMIDELVRHQLVLRESGFLLFPSQSTREHPERSALESKSGLVFIFAGPVLSIYTTLVVRLAQSGVFQKVDFWENVVTYTTRLGGTYGLFLASQGEGRAELNLFFNEVAREEMRYHFEDFVFRHLERHAVGTVQRQLRFACPKCGKVFADADVLYRQSRGFTFITCICDTAVSLLDGEQRLVASSTTRVREMEQVADSERERESVATIRQGKVIVQETNRLQLQLAKKTVQQMNIYISSASTLEDESLLDELGKQLSMLKRQPNVHFWEKRLIKPGEKREQEISDYIHQAHLIIFLMSSDFLASDHCYEEMKWAMRRKDAGEVVSVIPVLIRDTASWQETPVGALEPLPADRKPVSGRADRERVMRSIAECIQDIAHEIRQGF